MFADWIVCLILCCSKMLNSSRIWERFVAEVIRDEDVILGSWLLGKAKAFVVGESRLVGKGTFPNLPLQVRM